MFIFHTLSFKKLSVENVSIETRNVCNSPTLKTKTLCCNSYLNWILNKQLCLKEGYLRGGIFKLRKRIYFFIKFIFISLHFLFLK